jgi:hypothetical protein
MNKRPAITAPVRRGARVLRECDANGRLDVSGPAPKFGGVRGRDAADLKKYFEWNTRMGDFLADQAEAELAASEGGAA